MTGMGAAFRQSKTTNQVLEGVQFIVGTFCVARTDKLRMIKLYLELNKFVATDAVVYNKWSTVQTAKWKTVQIDLQSVTLQSPPPPMCPIIGQASDREGTEQPKEITTLSSREIII